MSVAVFSVIVYDGLVFYSRWQSAREAERVRRDEETRRAHNDYIQLAAETGVIGLTLYSAFWVAFWRRARRTEGEPTLPEAEPSRVTGASAAHGSFTFEVGSGRYAFRLTGE